jgi:hypothetical protein
MKEEKVRNKEKALRHAASQEHYAKGKTKTHKRMCVWVPRKREKEFTELVFKMKKNWET